MADSSWARVVELVWRGDATSAIRAQKDMAKQNRQTTDTLKKDSAEQVASFKRVEDSTVRLRGAFSGMLGFVGIGGVAFGLRDLKNSGVALQSQQTQLRQALKDTGQEAGNQAQQLFKYAEALSTHGGFGTTENLQSLTQFVRETRSATQARRLLSLSTEIARAKNMDLASTTQIVAKAYGGQARGLQALLGPLVAAKDAQVGLSVAHQQEIARLQDQAQLMGRMGSIWLRQQEVNMHLTAQQMELAQLTDKHATATQILALAQKEFAGSTAAFSGTTAGRISNLSNAYRNLKEQLGSALLPAINKIVSAGAVLAEFLAHNKGAVVAVTLAIAGLVTAFGALKVMRGLKDMALELGRALRIVGTTGATAGAEAAGGAEAATFAWRTFMMETVVGLVLVGLVEMVTHWHAVEHAAVAVWDGIKSAATAAWHWIENAAKNIYHALTWAFGEAWKFIQRTPFGALLGAGINLLHGNVGGAARSFLHGVTFGLLHTGGVVTPKYFWNGGPVGSDTVPGWLTPGEGVVNTTGMGVLGSGGLAALNAGQQPGANINLTPRMQVVDLAWNGNTLVRMLVKQVLLDAARGPSSFVGGSLLTGGPAGQLGLP